MSQVELSGNSNGSCRDGGNVMLMHVVTAIMTTATAVVLETTSL